MRIPSIVRLSNTFNLFDIALALGASMNGSMASTKQPHNPDYGIESQDVPQNQTKCQVGSREVIAW